MQTATGPAPVEAADEGVSPGSASTVGNGAQPTPDTAPPATPIVQLERVSKQYRGVVALRGVSLNIEPGEIFGLLGPNGAGKSTLLKLMLGFLHCDGGSIKLFGSTDLGKAHSRIGYLPEQPRYHGNFSGREYLEFQSKLAGLSTRDARTVTKRALDRVGLEEAANRRIRTYSKGMRQRLGLAVAVFASGDTPPELLILDEPASGLAPEGQVAVREVLLDCKRLGSTILLCSHQLTEVERICSQVGILRGGKLVALTRLDDQSRVVIRALPRSRALEVAPYMVEYLQNLHPAVIVRGGKQEDEPLVVSLPTGNGIPHAPAMKAAALRAMVDARWDIVSVHVENRDLESIYLQAVRPPRNEDADGKAAGKVTPETNGKADMAASAQVVQPVPMPPVEPESPAVPVIEAQPEEVPATTLEQAQTEPAEPATTSVPLIVRPVSPNGAAAQASVPASEPSTSAEIAPLAGRSGPSTAPLPTLPDNIGSQESSALSSSWVQDLRREGEER